MKKRLYLLVLLCLILLVSGCTSKDKPAAQIGSRIITQSIETPQPNKISENKFESTWGELKASEGGMVWDTLTDEQQDKVNYPTFDSGKVYWVKSGKSYHAVEWCYTLSRSKNIQSGTLSEALGKDLEPCSKCVGD